MVLWNWATRQQMRKRRTISCSKNWIAKQGSYCYTNVLPPRSSTRFPKLKNKRGVGNLDKNEWRYGQAQESETTSTKENV